jgi:hypothetical protein
MVHTGVTYSPGRPHACWALELLGFGGERKKRKRNGLLWDEQNDMLLSYILLSFIYLFGLFNSNSNKLLC